jgi:hypothetical protein
LLVVFGEVFGNPLFWVEAVRCECGTLQWLSTQLSMPRSCNLFDAVGDFDGLSFT